MSRIANEVNRINRRYEHIFVVVLAFLLIAVAFINQSYDSKITPKAAIRLSDTTQSKPIVTTAEQLDSQQTQLKNILIESLTASVAQENLTPAPGKIDTDKLIRLVNQDKFSHARHYLIELASDAVDRQDNQRLGEVMQILARVSATQGDLASTEIYLFEALGIFEQQNSLQDVADTQFLIGQMYAKRRQIAKLASWAYGNLLMARFYLSKGSHYQAKDVLDLSIEDNLRLGRTGAVASAYKTMARYYRGVNDYSGEQNALVEAGKFYAHSGQPNLAEQVVQQLRQRQAPVDLIETLNLQISQRLEIYESQINLVAQARDYMRLYSLYKNKGEHGRAWQFRVKASEILSRTEKRDMFFRSPDVMAVLYDSNFNIQHASKYYKQAAEHFSLQNQTQEYEHVMQSQAALN